MNERNATSIIVTVGQGNASITAGKETVVTAGGLSIFVFGSNSAGIHGGGAAAYACKSLGAEWGVGEGPTGQCYALPTKDRRIQSRSLEDVKDSVDRFISYATDHPELTFQVTRIGCGLAGFTDEEVAPMFIDSPDNCEFDSAWQQWLPTKKVWGTF